MLDRSQTVKSYRDGWERGQQNICMFTNEKCTKQTSIRGRGLARGKGRSLIFRIDIIRGPRNVILVHCAFECCISAACREEAIRNYSGSQQASLQNPTEVENKIFEQSRSKVSDPTVLFSPVLVGDSSCT